jgi:hypothetical protein
MDFGGTGKVQLQVLIYFGACLALNIVRRIVLMRARMNATLGSPRATLRGLNISPLATCSWRSITAISVVEPLALPRSSGGDKMLHDPNRQQDHRHRRSPLVDRLLRDLRCRACRRPAPRCRIS